MTSYVMEDKFDIIFMEDEFYQRLRISIAFWSFHNMKFILNFDNELHETKLAEGQSLLSDNIEKGNLSKAGYLVL